MIYDIVHIINFGNKYKAFLSNRSRALKVDKDKSIIAQYAIEYSLKHKMLFCMHKKDGSVDFNLDFRIKE